jgi:hypothetical protein
MVGQIGPPGVLRRLSDAARIALRAAPARMNRFVPMKWINIYDCWYQAILASGQR